MATDGTLGAPEVFATMARGADGIAFDRHGNLLVAGFGALQVVARGATTATTLATEPVVMEWPSNLAFGAGRGFPRKTLYVANFGEPLGSGTTVVRVEYNHRSAR
jgi:sugar lactone lactonase YvrE